MWRGSSGCTLPARETSSQVILCQVFRFGDSLFASLQVFRFPTVAGLWHLRGEAILQARPHRPHGPLLRTMPSCGLPCRERTASFVRKMWSFHSAPGLLRHGACMLCMCPRRRTACWRSWEARPLRSAASQCSLPEQRPQSIKSAV